ncbi:hypothetical protein N9M16_08970 [Candidatus Dependentiae bacterium]|nr:hypothetical protein [Candidatus Dependentiae bacterium]
MTSSRFFWVASDWEASGREATARHWRRMPRCREEISRPEKRSSFLEEADLCCDLKPRKETLLESGATILAVTSDAIAVEV